jgi:putative intracellular protease/amidase
MKILMVLTSHDILGSTGLKTRFWLEEFAAPYFVFRDAGVQLTLASPNGGQPPIDPKSDLPENQTPAMTRFKQDLGARKELSQTVKLADVRAEDFDTVFYPGGHGPMWDHAESPDSIALLEYLLQFRQADCLSLSLSWRASSRHIPGRASCERKTRDRLHQW